MAAQLTEWLLGFAEWVQGFGAWGGAIYALGYLAASLFVPASILTLGAGYLFGLLGGYLVVTVGSVGGAAAAFLIARYFARGWVERRFGASPRFASLDGAVAESGWKIVFLLRLSPVFPFLFLNYAFGLTKISFRHYFLASWIGMIPGTFLYVYLGTLVTNLAELGAGKRETTTAEQVFYWAGLAVTLVATAFVTRLARRALKKVDVT